MRTPRRAPRLPGLTCVQPIGSGGYADVFLYVQNGSRRPMAVKVLRDGQSAPAVRRFADEAQAMARLGGHRHVVQLLGSGACGDGRPFLVMEYCPPPNLALRSGRQPFTVPEVLRTGIQLAGAVEAAHRAGVVHRDIKPANVLVTRSGVLVLADWGAAGRLGLAAGPQDDVEISVPWAAPELLSAESDGTVSSDVYSLAATLWSLLVGRSPFALPGGDNSAYALSDRVLSLPAPPTGRDDVPRALERLLAHALDKNPVARPSTASELAHRLQRVGGSKQLPSRALAAPLSGGTSIAAAPPTPLVDTSLSRLASVAAVGASAPVVGG
ncbi:MAG TPA: serine/threonine-protein kinase [Dermatophilaceae bacterium]|nr:serine/threonine-protein kinase [Dermatophilaceae bacterium]